MMSVGRIAIAQLGTEIHPTLIRQRPAESNAECTRTAGENDSIVGVAPRGGLCTPRRYRVFEIACDGKTDRCKP